MAPTSCAPVAVTTRGITVVVPTYNRQSSLRDTLSALGAQDPPPRGLAWDILVVDNNSCDQTPRVVEEFARTASVPVRYCFESRPGKSHALNAGIARAAREFLLFTDDDVVPSRSWVAAAARATERWGADGVGGRILLRWPAAPPRWLARSEHAQQNLGLMDFDEPRVLKEPVWGRPAVWGGNMGFRREVLESVGGFDPALGPVGARHSMGEDTDIVRRVMAAGWMVVYDPSLLVWHRIAAERMRKGYFWKWAFRYGVVEASILEMPPAPRIFGVPRWRYRAVTVTAVRCLLRSTFLRDDAFDCQRELARALGQAWGLARRR